MTSLPDLIRLFTDLASDLRRSTAVNVAGDEAARIVSSLTKTLNIDDDVAAAEPRVRVLDAALALMGFRPREISSARIESLVRTIVAVLSSSVSCKVFRSVAADAELLLVGSSISSGDRGELIEACVTVVSCLREHSSVSPIAAGLSDSLLYAVLKVAVLSSSFYALSAPLSASRNETTSVDDRRMAVSKLTHLSEEMTVGSDVIPPRLLLWYLDPLILKHDISGILQEIIQRPFICLKEELHDRMAWRSIIICLVTSPTMFIEARALLHKWFLVTNLFLNLVNVNSCLYPICFRPDMIVIAGVSVPRETFMCAPTNSQCQRGSTFVLDLQIAIVSAVLDVLSRPMWWGVSMELGLKYQFSHAYFPSKHHELLAILSGHISCETFLDLVSRIGMAVALTTKHSYPIYPSCGTFGCDTSVTMADNKSLWALVLQFPVWFYFAASLIFYRKNSDESHLSKFIYDAVKSEATIDLELQQAATQYISWILSSVNEVHRYLLINHIQDISKSWMTIRSNCIYEHKLCSNTHNKTTLGRSKKLRIPKANVCEKLHLAEEDDTGSTVRMWLKEFDAVHAKFCRTVIGDVPDEAKVKRNSYAHPKLLFVNILLGIFILSPSCLDEDGCEMLFHYVVTGEILHFKEPQKAEDLTLLPTDWHTWALHGSCVMFNLFDIVEDMSEVLFEKEDNRVNYICRLKSKACGYLLRCVKVLLKFEAFGFGNDGAGGRDTMVDLFSRLRRWMQQGRNVFEGYQEFEYVIDELTKRFTVSNLNIKERRLHTVDVNN